MTVAQPLILFFTDFGTDGPYLGQMEAAIMDEALQSRVINLAADAPTRDPYHAAYLLAALVADMPPGCVVVAVVDPGVGSSRMPLLVESDGRVYVGPDNGLLSRIVVNDPQASIWRIDWRPPKLSTSFHGRDLFAPVAGLVSIGQAVERSEVQREQLVGMEWPDDLAEIVYIDHYGNAMTGIRAAAMPAARRLSIGGIDLPEARTFSDVEPGAAFWYENSSGLVEVAVNGGNAARQLGLEIGSFVTVSGAALS